METTRAVALSSTPSPKQESTCNSLLKADQNFNPFMQQLSDQARASFKPCFSKFVNNFEVQDYVISGDLSQKDVSDAVAVLEKANMPCGHETALKAVTALRLRTTAKPEHSNDIAAMVALYVDDMADYPEDVVIEACRSLARSNKWFPAWAELYEALEWRVRKRRLMLKAMTNHAERSFNGEE